LERDLALGAPGEAAFEHRPQRLVGELGGGADPRDLAVVLDRPQLRHDRTRRNQLPSLGEQLAQARVVGDREALLEKTQPASAAPERAGDTLEQVVEHDLPLEGLGYLLAGLRLVA